MTRRQQVIELTIVLALIFAAYVVVRGDGPTVYPNGMTRSGISFEVLTAKTLAGKGTRKNSWHEDDSQSKEWRASVADYTGSGFDIFHHAPDADFGSFSGKSGAWVLTNASPGDRSLNRGIWAQLEKQVREMVSDTAIVQVYTGPVFSPSPDGTIRIKTMGANRVWIPAAFAKCVVVENDEQQPRSYAWLIPNEKPKSDNLLSYRTTIDAVEFEWGFDCKWGLDTDVENRLEAER